MFLLLFFYLKISSLQTQKLTFTAKFSASPSLEVFLCSYSLPGPSYSLLFWEPWHCIDFQHYDCIACCEIVRIFDSVHS